MRREESLKMVDSGEILKILVDEERFTTFRGNKVVFGTMSDGQSVVAKFPHNKDSATHEFAGYRIVAAESIRVPSVIGLVSNATGNVGILTHRIFGKNLYEDNFNGAKYQLGTMVKQLHGLKVGGNAVHANASVYSDYETKVKRFLTAPFNELIRDVPIYRLMELLSQDVGGDIDNQSGVMTHHDLHDDQIVAVDRLLYLIDFEEWEISCPTDDIAIYLYHSLRTKRPESQFVDFCRGYTQEEEFGESDKTVMNYLLLQFSLEMLDYYANYRTKEVQYAVLYLQRAVDYVNKERVWKI